MFLIVLFSVTLAFTPSQNTPFGLRKLFCGSVTTGALGGDFNKSSIPDSR